MKIIAQLTYIPLNTEDPRAKVQDILEHLAQYDNIDIEVGYLSTGIIGEKETVFHVIEDLYDIMRSETPQFRYHIELLNTPE